ncbi:MAG TPA: hypothetical protein VFX44_04405 [Solirubrobacterales bacterium]|nr:hypothetical protein [Solirubrobacterales bacterium]
MSRNAGGCATATIRRDDIDSRSAVIEKTVQQSGRSMRENCPGPAGKDRCQQMSLFIEKRMSYRVNALVDPVEPSCIRPLPRHIRIERRQLPQRDQSILPSS